MHRGRLVELGPADEVADHPRHPYTQQLVAAVPVPDPDVQARRRSVRSPAAALDVEGSGCLYVSRCEQRMDVCIDVDPPPRVVGQVIVRCHLFPDAPTTASDHNRTIPVPPRRHLPTALPVPISVGATKQEVGALVAERILDLLDGTPADRPFSLACPAGRSPLSTYTALGEIAAERGADLSRVGITMLDEYAVQRGDDIVLCEPDAHYSCRRYVHQRLLPLVNARLPAGRQIPPANVRVPDPADPAAYERELGAAGGINVVLLASGASDGHVAFNPPGSDRSSTTRVVALAESTRRDNLATFPEFTGLDEVPMWGVTIGLATILHARHAVMVLVGRGKADALGRLVRCGAFDPTWPASVIFDHPDPWIVVDQAAAAGVPALESPR